MSGEAAKGKFHFDGEGAASGEDWGRAPLIVTAFEGSDVIISRVDERGISSRVICYGGLSATFGIWPRLQQIIS